MKSRYNRIMVATFGYDNGSRRTSRTLGDTPGTQTTWTYGRQDNLPTAINSDIAGASFTYTYDANKNKLTEGISAPMANYGFNSTSYDSADRLTAWNRTDGNLDQAWDLSLVGDWATFTENLVQQTRSHTAVHEIAAIDAKPIAHDAAGNLTRNAGDTLDRYTWDFDNRLLAADVDQDGTPDCLYRHDALGRRVSKTVPDGESTATMVFVGTIQALAYSPHAMQVVAEYPADAAPGSAERKFVYATYIDEPVMMLATNGATTTPYYYHQNSLYSVAALTDVSAAVVERYAYSAYGEPIFLDAAATPLDPQATLIGNPYLFTARRFDQENGLYYYRARMYDAELGRFVSRDPIGYEAGSMSLYEYVNASPLSRMDSSGKSGFGFRGESCHECMIGPGGYNSCIWNQNLMYDACLGGASLTAVLELVGCAALCNWANLGSPFAYAACVTACTTGLGGLSFILTVPHCNAAWNDAESKCAVAYNRCTLKYRHCCRWTGRIWCGPKCENLRPTK
ncbi:MAG: RHS repeat-associated core domain-containing protein [Patescibacteria group bacterium]|nr:RHS repeat-associated core domain-containing protein [Patescibacteria group bacterium]